MIRVADRENQIVRQERVKKRKFAQSQKIGLARALSKLGHCSRSQAGELIREGRVSLNGSVRRDPETPVNLKADRITIDGKHIAASRKIYLLLNKPRGTVTTASDEKGRTTVYSHLPKGIPWVGPAGRLDRASEGLLLLTNDSEWSAKILAPETHLDKTYHVRVNAVVDDAIIRRLLDGVRANNGDFLRAKAARVVRRGGKHSWIEIVLDEGKNRQIRRMLEELGIEVLRLVRIAIGPLTLGDLAKGATRSLTAEEKNALDRAMQKEAGN